MAIAVGCAQCGRRYQVRPEFAGRSIPCKSCGAMMAVPVSGPMEITEYGDGRPVMVDPFDDHFGGRSSSSAPRPRPRSGSRSQSAKPARRSEGSSTGLIVALSIAGGMAFLLAVGAVVYLVGFRNKADDPKDPADGFSVAKTEIPSFPELPAPRVHPPSGAKIHFVDLGNHHGNGSGPGKRMKMRIYLPPGEHERKSLGCVLVAPAGTNMLRGNDMDNDDYHAETLPYVQAGYAVVFYSLDGPIEDMNKVTDAELLAAYHHFKDAKAGVVNGRNALEFVLAKLPQVDPNRIFSAGHSSAGTVSLLFAAHEPRLKGCIAYAPVVDVEARLSELLVDPDVTSEMPGIKDFAIRSSPKTHTDKFLCPVFLFHAVDDSNVPFHQTSSYVQSLKNAGKTVSFVTSPNGDHYESMVQRGIPAAIQWLKALPHEGGASNPPPSTEPPGSQSPPVASRTEPTFPPGSNPFPPARPNFPIRPPGIRPPRTSPPGGNAGLSASFQVLQYRGSGDIESSARRILSQFSQYDIGTVNYDAGQKMITVDLRSNFANTAATKSALRRAGFLIGRTTISTRSM